MDSSGEKRTVTLQRNPLLINPVIDCVFKYLSLEDLKQCRVVCHEWNSVSIQILDDQSKVTLHSKQRLTSFLEFFKAYDTQDFPSTNFDLKLSHTNWHTEEYKQLMDLFNTLGKNIITLRVLDSSQRDGIYFTPMIQMATNLVSLTLWSPNSAIELNILGKIKYLSLILCCVSLDSFENRIAPSNIVMHNVTFERKENSLQKVLINDYIDFSGCSEIKIICSKDFVMTFDMSRDVVSAPKVYLDGVRVINCGASPAKVDKRTLSSGKYCGVGIKELAFRRSKLNLSVLPKSLEKLSLDLNTYDTINCSSIDLPNLKCLFFLPAFGVTTDRMSPTAYDMGIITSKFRLCPKLVDMVLHGWCSTNDWRYNINVDLMPVTLNRIKLTDSKNINLVGDTVFHVDSLLLNTGTFADTHKFLNKIKPKVVVVELQLRNVEDTANEIVSFIEESRNFEKILIKISHEGNLPSYVEDDSEESNCYEFTNQINKNLTAEEFNLYWF